MAPATALAPYSMGARPRVTSMRSTNPAGNNERSARPSQGLPMAHRQETPVSDVPRLRGYESPIGRANWCAGRRRDSAKNIGNRNGLTCLQRLVVKRYRRTRSTRWPARCGKNNFLYRSGALPLSQRRDYRENPGYAAGQAHDRRSPRRRRIGLCYPVINKRQNPCTIDTSQSCPRFLQGFSLVAEGNGRNVVSLRADC